MGKIKEEVAKLVPPTIFFFLALHLVALIRKLMTEGTGLPLTSSAQIAVAALIIGKAVLLADLWPSINRFPNKPLVYNVAWKTLIYFAVATVIHYLERLYEFARAAGGIVAGNEKLLSEIVWPHFIAIQLVLVVLVFNYCVFRELGRVMGEGKLMAIFFGTRPDRGSPAEGTGG